MVDPTTAIIFSRSFRSWSSFLLFSCLLKSNSLLFLLFNLSPLVLSLWMIVLVINCVSGVTLAELSVPQISRVLFANAYKMIVLMILSYLGSSMKLNVMFHNRGCRMDPCG